MAKISYLECSRCGERLNANEPQTLCTKCAGPLYVRYDLALVARSVTPEVIAHRAPDMWRYKEVLPEAAPVTLGEGFTPLLKSRNDEGVWIKDEGLNPTGSFKARGLGMAVTMLRHYGVKKVAIPSAGNAASALAAYCAAAAIEAHIFMPRDVPMANRVECEAYGAKVTLVDGLISDCARMVAQGKETQGWFDISTLKEPFRVEGKKTMGYEVAEQMGWTLPDAIIYPTGGGVGLIGMWKAFDEMEEMGWLKSPKGFRPKMIAVQAAGCAPIPKAWDEHKPASEMWQGAQTLASGLRVPKAYGDFIVLDVVKKSSGTAVAVTDAEIMDSVKEWARHEGIFAAPEGAAALSAYRKLRATGFLKAADKVVLFNTGAGNKYIDVVAEFFGMNDNAAKELPKSRSIGGIIQPY
ncbi:MAG TPA: threonine synthase [Clostridia bacterium]|nr:threonine synthase [Clostridia bacterium]